MLLGANVTSISIATSVINFQLQHNFPRILIATTRMCWIQLQKITQNATSEDCWMHQSRISSASSVLLHSVCCYRLWHHINCLYENACHQGHTLSSNLWKPTNVDQQVLLHGFYPWALHRNKTLHSGHCTENLTLESLKPVNLFADSSWSSPSCYIWM